MAKILVTGGAGFVGSYTVEALLAAGHNVVAIDNLRTGREENILSLSGHSNWTFLRQDILDEDNFHRAMCAAAPDVVLHLAGLVSVPESVAKPQLNFELNVRSVRVMIDAASKAGVRRVIFSSSSAVYGETNGVPLDEESATRPLSPYGIAKLEGEAMLFNAGRELGFEAMCLRYFNIYGARQHGDSPYSGVVSSILARLRSGQSPVIFGDGRQTRDFIHVADVARANLLAIDAPYKLGGVYNICSGQEISVTDLVAALSKLFGSSAPPTFEPARFGDVRRSVGNPDRARRHLNFSANIPMTSGLNECRGTSGAVTD
jgi:UDP-glucose 4-epimerase